MNNFKSLFGSFLFFSAILAFAGCCFMKHGVKQEVPAKPVPVSEIKVASLTEYYSLLFKTISESIVEPVNASKGTVKAAFTLLSDGTLKALRIMDGSSYDPALREAALIAIKNSAPFPPFPDEIKGQSQKDFVINMQFK